LSSSTHNSMWLIILAGILWGVTNPLLKKFTAGFATAEKDHPAEKAAKQPGVWGDVQFLFRRPKYLVTQALNLVGSVAFAAGMSEASLSVGPAVANGLSMALTCVVSTLVLKEEAMSSRAAAGVALVFSGMLLCVTA
jgi:multidrug transporter EmrE-like cation transporter